MIDWRRRWRVVTMKVTGPKANAVPTDLKILQAIYDRYHQVFADFQPGDKTRDAKIYVPIDIVGLAADLEIGPDILVWAVVLPNATRTRLQARWPRFGVRGSSLPSFTGRAYGSQICADRVARRVHSELPEVRCPFALALRGHRGHRTRLLPVHACVHVWSVRRAPAAKKSA